jgi:PAS domain S-box-containing protein
MKYLIIRDEGGTPIIADCNATFIKNLGYAREQVLGQPLAKFYTSQSRTVLEEGGFQREFRSEVKTSIERDLVAQDGRIIHALLKTAPETDEMGRDVGALAMYLDITERKLTEEALEKRSAQLRTLIDTLPDLVWLKDPDGIYLDCNRRFEQLINANEKDVIGKTDYNFFDQELADFFRENDLKAIVAGKPTMNEEQLSFASDGHQETLETIKTPVFNARGEVIGVLGIGRDITARKRAEQSLELVKRSIDAAPDGAYWMDVEGRFIYVNDAGCNALGYSRDELLQMSISDVNPSVTPQRWAEVCQSLRDKTNFTSQSVHRRKNGSEFPVEITSNYIEFNGQEYVNGFARDITKRKQAEEALRKSEEKFTKAFQESPIIVVITRVEDGCFIEVNESFEKIVGYTRAEALGRTSLELGLFVNPAERERLVSIMLKNGRLRNEEILYRTKGGKVITTLYSAELIELDGEKCLLATIENITERKQAERMQQELELLREMDRLRSDFISNVSHELRTPLGLILVMVTALRKEELHFDEETTRGFLRDIEEETRSLQNIVDDLLDISRAQSGKLVMNMAQADLRETLDHNVKMFAAQDTNHRLDIQLPAYALEAHLDASRIEQVLRNLLDNASKYSPAGTSITVEAKKEGNEIRVAVSDEGPGVPPLEHERIFERFYRITEKDAVYIPGLGLGLSISRSIIEAHGGKLWVEDRPQRGSIFIFTIPVQEVS